VPNIGAPTTSYPDGLIVDNTSGITGTAVTEILYGDLIQTIHKLRRLAGMTANGLPDDETNGFQVLTTLLMQGLPHWQAPSSAIAFGNIKFVKYTNSVYYHKTSTNTSNPPSVDTANWAFVFGWNGTKIVFSNDDAVMSAINQVANDLSARCTTIEGRTTSLEGRANSLEGRTNTLETAAGYRDNWVLTEHPSNTVSGSVFVYQTSSKINVVSGIINTGGFGSSDYFVVAYISYGDYPNLKRLVGTVYGVACLNLDRSAPVRLRNIPFPVLGEMLVVEFKGSTDSGNSYHFNIAYPTV